MPAGSVNCQHGRARQPVIPIPALVFLVLISGMIGIARGRNRWEAQCVEGT
ncbi:MAG TPA: hypothetical protein VE503_12945 [Ornithinibacter sp.]|nr:hypothetical protein [Ornithinibacter sp.]